MTQYFDTIKEVGNASKSNTILIPHSPGGMHDLSEQIRNAMITANEVEKQGKQADDHRPTQSKA